MTQEDQINMLNQLIEYISDSRVGNQIVNTLSTSIQNENIPTTNETNIHIHIENNNGIIII